MGSLPWTHTLKLYWVIAVATGDWISDLVYFLTEEYVNEYLRLAAGVFLLLPVLFFLASTPKARHYFAVVLSFPYQRSTRLLQQWARAWVTHPDGVCVVRYHKWCSKLHDGWKQRFMYRPDELRQFTDCLAFTFTALLNKLVWIILHVFGFAVFICAGTLYSVCAVAFHALSIVLLSAVGFIGLTVLMVLASSLKLVAHPAVCNLFVDDAEVDPNVHAQARQGDADKQDGDAAAFMRSLSLGRQAQHQHSLEPQSSRSSRKMSLFASRKKKSLSMEEWAYQFNKAVMAELLTETIPQLVVTAYNTVQLNNTSNTFYATVAFSSLIVIHTAWPVFYARIHDQHVRSFVDALKTDVLEVLDKDHVSMEVDCSPKWFPSHEQRQFVQQGAIEDVPWTLAFGYVDTMGAADKVGGPMAREERKQQQEAESMSISSSACSGQMTPGPVPGSLELSALSWTCQQCTFSNNHTRTTCEICSSPKLERRDSFVTGPELSVEEKTQDVSSYTYNEDNDDEEEDAQPGLDATLPPLPPADAEDTQGGKTVNTYNLLRAFYEYWVEDHPNAKSCCSVGAWARAIPFALCIFIVSLSMWLLLHVASQIHAAEASCGPPCNTGLLFDYVRGPWYYAWSAPAGAIILALIWTLWVLSDSLSYCTRGNHCAASSVKSKLWYCDVCQQDIGESEPRHQCMQPKCDASLCAPCFERYGKLAVRMDKASRPTNEAVADSKEAQNCCCCGPTYHRPHHEMVYFRMSGSAFDIEPTMDSCCTPCRGPAASGLNRPSPSVASWRVFGVSLLFTGLALVVLFGPPGTVAMTGDPVLTTAKLFFGSQNISSSDLYWLATTTNILAEQQQISATVPGFNYTEVTACPVSGSQAVVLGCVNSLLAAYVGQYRLYLLGMAVAAALVLLQGLAVFSCSAAEVAPVDVDAEARFVAQSMRLYSQSKALRLEQIAETFSIDAVREIQSRLAANSSAVEARFRSRPQWMLPAYGQQRQSKEPSHHVVDVPNPSPNPPPVPGQSYWNGECECEEVAAVCENMNAWVVARCLQWFFCLVSLCMIAESDSSIVPSANQTQAEFLLVTTIGHFLFTTLLLGVWMWTKDVQDYVDHGKWYIYPYDLIIGIFLFSGSLALGLGCSAEEGCPEDARVGAWMAFAAFLAQVAHFVVALRKCAGYLDQVSN